MQRRTDRHINSTEVDRAAADRNASLTFENISSIGLRSGLDGGNGMTRAPACATAATTACRPRSGIEPFSRPGLSHLGGCRV